MPLPLGLPGSFEKELSWEILQMLLIEWIKQKATLLILTSFFWMLIHLLPFKSVVTCLSFTRHYNHAFFRVIADNGPVPPYSGKPLKSLQLINSLKMQEYKVWMKAKKPVSMTEPCRQGSRQHSSLRITNSNTSKQKHIYANDFVQWVCGR